MNTSVSTLDKLEDIRRRVILYAIVFRNAGVALQFSEDSKASPANKFGLTVYAYYPNIEEAVDGEYVRLTA